MARNKGKTRVVKNEGRRDGKKPPRSHVSYVDIEQVKQRYGGRAGQLGHLAHVDGQRAAAQVHLVDLVVGKLLVSDDG